MNYTGKNQLSIVELHGRGIYITSKSSFFPTEIYFFPQFCGVRRACFYFFFHIFPHFPPFFSIFPLFSLFLPLFSPFSPFFFFPFLHFFSPNMFFQSFPPPGGNNVIYIPPYVSQSYQLK